MTTKTMSRVKLWLGVGAASVILLGAASVWPGSDDDAIDRDQRDSERRREAVVKADYLTGGGQNAFIDWGKAGAITRDDNPSTPFERVVEVQLGDRVSILVHIKKFDRGLKCSITVNGKVYEGESWFYGCEARANVE